MSTTLTRGAREPSCGPFAMRPTPGSRQRERARRIGLAPLIWRASAIVIAAAARRRRVARFLRAFSAPTTSAAPTARRARLRRAPAIIAAPATRRVRPRRTAAPTRRFAPIRALIFRPLVIVPFLPYCRGAVVRRRLIAAAISNGQGRHSVRDQRDCDVDK